ncbi:tRNA 2'-phosphotransferase [Coemansia guatemalensis]|uniref:2'-phosphotransferase n=1 Tax=Coemansia guatemalensis TaxID=2761395 RepID=A0A9W8HZ63_9FUNG|nr:tRNA 2'-phosphotransferase [Coemansia guatemalensis]
MRRPRRRGKNDSPDVKVSKLMSYLLRHGAVKEGLALRDDGSILVSELLAYPRLQSVSFEKLRQIVDADNKKRYVLFQENQGSAEPAWFIRATQGHTLQVSELPLVKIAPENMPDCIVHGTMKSKLPLIMKSGLSKMARTHIHFATGLPSDKAVISGMRSTADAFIYIDGAKAIEDGIEFYLSENGVVLSEGLDKSGIIPSSYFEKVELKNADK